MNITRLIIVCGAVILTTVAVGAQRGGNTNAIASLKGAAMPQRPGLSNYVADSQALIVLGKALFWDAQVGSDGRTACASCHFHAGADHRITNQIAAPAASSALVRPNTTLSLGDFPFHAFADPNSNQSAVIRDRREIVGSAGLVKRRFVSVTESDGVDVGADAAAGTFLLGGLKVRQVTSRDRKSTRLNSSHVSESRMPSSA